MQTGVGSGFVWDAFGHCVTNYHCISKLDKSSDVSLDVVNGCHPIGGRPRSSPEPWHHALCTLSLCHPQVVQVQPVQLPGAAAVPPLKARIVAMDTQHDLAVLQVEDEAAWPLLTPARLGTSADLKVGQLCRALARMKREQGDSASMPSGAMPGGVDARPLRAGRADGHGNRGAVRAQRVAGGGRGERAQPVHPVARRHAHLRSDPGDPGALTTRCRGAPCGLQVCSDGCWMRARDVWAVLGVRRRTRPSTRATAAGLFWTATGGWWASTRRPSPAAGR